MLPFLFQGNLIKLFFSFYLYRSAITLPVLINSLYTKLTVKNIKR